MDIKTVTVRHPKIKDRDITLLLVDNKLDRPSTEFLVHEARYGGRLRGKAGKASHKGKAIHIAELYRNLGEMGLDWRSASEFDVKMIRNAMLCWDINDNKDYENFPYEAIRNDTMNHKINTWFKFYRYMDEIGEQNNMVMDTILVKKRSFQKGLLDHLDKKEGSQKDEYIEIWTLRVSPSPKKTAYHALSRTEFSRLRQHLRNIDVVYEALAVFMVETGLRITAALEAVESDFNGLVPLLSSGLTMNDCVKRKYIPKGRDEPRNYDLPLRTIRDVRELYLARIRNDRVYAYEERRERLGHKIEDDVLWILENGKPMKKHDVWSAFKKVSRIMKRTEESITPHWLRHTFATWTIMDIADKKGISLANTGTTPDTLLVTALEQKLGHASILTTLRYIASALKLMGIDVNDGVVQMSLRTFRRDRRSQELVAREAKKEFGEDFDEDGFDVIKYALSREIVVDDELVSCK